MKRFAIAAGVVLVLAGAGVSSAHEGLHGPVKKRMDVMKWFGNSVKTIAVAVRSDEAWNAEAVEKAAAQIRSHAEELPGYFPKDDIPDHSSAKPVIWQQWERFNGLLVELEAKADALNKAAETGDRLATAAAFRNMGATCRDCHEIFRAPRR